MTDGNTSPPVETADKAAPVGQPRRRILLRLASWIVRGAVILWAALAIYYSNLPWPWLRSATTALYIAAALGLLWRARSSLRRRAAFWITWAAVAVWWMLIPPSNTRQWQADVESLPWAEVRGNLVTVHNIRNCRYRSEFDCDVRHYDAVFDLNRLQSADLFLVQWGPVHIAHAMMSFGFDGDRYLCFSIETRKEIGEGYSALKGFFKQYELTYVAGDERDLVRLRTNCRGEQVYLYRLRAKPATVRGVLLGYLGAVNSLHDRPEWYNALTTNCTTTIWGHTRPFTSGSWNWRILLNGHLNELLYERGTVDRSFSLPELKARSRINDRAVAAGEGENFSRRIRDGLPGMAPPGTMSRDLGEREDR